jgi:hypothetical protein
VFKNPNNARHHQLLAKPLERGVLIVKRLTLLTMLLALSIAPVAALSDGAWPGWMTVHVSGIPSNETVRIAVQYTTSTGTIKYAQYHAREGSPARFPLGSKAHDLHVIASVDGTNKVRTFRFATVPSSFEVNFNH